MLTLHVRANYKEKGTRKAVYYKIIRIFWTPAEMFLHCLSPLKKKRDI